MTANFTTELEAPHEGPIKTPRQLIVAVLFAFVIPVAVIVMLAVFVTTGNKPLAGSDALSPQAIASRIAPVGRVTVKDVNDPAALANGESVFKGQCISCHGAGLLGAPKLGDAAAWSPRVGHGYEALVTSALRGKGAMPPQGGGDYTDLEIARAVVYMANAGGGKFEEPKAAPELAAAPEAAAPAATAMASAAPAAAPAANTAPAAASAQQAAGQTATQAVAAANTTAAAATPAAAGAGAAVPALYAQVCQVCHSAGVAGAPKVGDKAAWAPRLVDGIDGMTAIAIKGKGAMPPRGGSQATDAQIKEVVTYMANASK